jgi:hypothetical protein
MPDENLDRNSRHWICSRNGDNDDWSDLVWIIDCRDNGARKFPDWDGHGDLGWDGYGAIPYVRSWNFRHKHNNFFARFQVKRERTLRVSTLKALERKAMRWYGSYCLQGDAIHNIPDRNWTALINAMARHAAARKGKRRG